MYKADYNSPLGKIYLAADKKGLFGVWFAKPARIFDYDNFIYQPDTFKYVFDWLDKYFEGKNPSIEGFKLVLYGTDFQKKVWDTLLKIPYGKTVSYGQITKQMNMLCPRAVGSAIGRNPISVIIPCHRVINANGNIGKYAYGTETKIKLLKLEKAI